MVPTRRWKERFEAATVTFLLVFEFAVERSFVLLSCGWGVDEVFKLEVAGTCTQNSSNMDPKEGEQPTSLLHGGL